MVIIRGFDGGGFYDYNNCLICWFIDQVLSENNQMMEETVVERIEKNNLKEKKKVRFIGVNVKIEKSEKRRRKADSDLY